jgi:hypothetical protein
MTHRRRRERESGFAILMIFVMAAVIAIGLYYEMPRVAFESQRVREQTLVDRGMQYRRAIQLFYRKFGRYPASMDDLETTNNVRFLRHKYKDPLTGKDDWRIIHMGPGGILTDSLVQKAIDPLKADKDKQASTTTGAGTGTSGTTGTTSDDQTQGLNLATVRRPSDTMVGGPPGGGTVNPNDPNQPVQPYPQQPTFPPGQQQFVGQQPGQTPQPGQPLLPGQVPSQPINPNQPYDPNNPNPNPQLPLQPYDPNNPNPVQPPPGFVQGRGGFVPVPQAPAYPGAPTTTPGQPGAPGSSATNIIQNLLTTPRQAPASIASAASSDTSTAGSGGIAGVASKYEGTGIKIIHERKKYKEWEFIYDFKNDSNRQQQAAGQVPGQPGQSNGLSVPGTPGTGTTAPGTPGQILTAPKSQ